MKGRTRKESPAKDKKRSRRYERMRRDPEKEDDSPPWEDNPLKRCEFALATTEAFLSMNATDYGAAGYALVMLRQDIYAAVASEGMGPSYDEDFKKIKPDEAWKGYLKLYIKGLSDFTEVTKRGQAALTKHTDYLVRLAWRLWQCFSKIDEPNDKKLLELIQVFQVDYPFQTVTMECAACHHWLGPLPIRGNESELELKARVERYYDWIIYGETGTFCSSCVEKNLHLEVVA